MRRELRRQPLQHFQLVACRRSPYLNEKLQQGGSIQRQIARSLIAARTKRTEIARVVFSMQALVDDVANMKTYLARRIGRFRLSGHRTAHLAGKSVPVQYERSELLGYVSRKGRSGFRGKQQILPRLEIGTIIMRQNLEAFFVPQLPDATSPLACICDATQFVRRHNAAEVRKEVLPQLCP